MDWKQEMLKRLDALAEKLGTTAAYLWSVLVKQAYVDGIEALAGALFSAVIFVILLKCAKRTWARGERDDDDGDWYTGAVILYILAGIAVFFAGAALTGALGHFINPGYYALHEVLDTIHN